MALFELAVALHDSVILGFPFLLNGNLDLDDPRGVLVAFVGGLFVFFLVVVEISSDLGDVATTTALQFILELIDFALQVIILLLENVVLTFKFTDLNLEISNLVVVFFVVLTESIVFLFKNFDFLFLDNNNSLELVALLFVFCTIIFEFLDFIASIVKLFFSVLEVFMKVVDFLLVFMNVVVHSFKIAFIPFGFLPGILVFFSKFLALGLEVLNLGIIVSIIFDGSTVLFLKISVLCVPSFDFDGNLCVFDLPVTC